CLVEQPHVLNCNRRLVSEGLQEFDLSVREEAYLSAGDRNGSDGDAIAQYRNANATPISADRRQLAEGVIGVRIDIRDLHDTLLKDRARGNALPTWRLRKCASVDLNYLGGEAVMGHEVEELAIKVVDKAELALAEPRRALGNHVEHRLHVIR